MGYKQSALEGMVMHSLFSGIYKDKTVLVTGHTGFKGSWLVYWLNKMGAKVVGYSLEPPSNPNHIGLIDLDIVSIIGNLNDQKNLHKIFAIHNPEIVFHLAAHALVRHSYDEPVETYETNGMGTLKVLEACRECSSVKAIINVTSDKAYENREWPWGYREIDSMGGYDPYSSSKGCVELLTSSYRNSYFNLDDYGVKHNTLLASCRAGNVIGGGDWAEDRLVPDMIRAISKGESVEIRNPDAIRPWQHVLEPLSGYLKLVEKLHSNGTDFSEGWNFGPHDNEAKTVSWTIERLTQIWGSGAKWSRDHQQHPHEATYLKLDCSKAHSRLDWHPAWNIDLTLEKIVEWHKAFNQGADMRQMTLSQINSFQTS